MFRGQNIKICAMLSLNILIQWSSGRFDIEAASLLHAYWLITKKSFKYGSMKFLGQDTC